MLNRRGALMGLLAAPAAGKAAIEGRTMSRSFGGSAGFAVEGPRPDPDNPIQLARRALEKWSMRRVNRIEAERSAYSGHGPVAVMTKKSWSTAYKAHVSGQLKFNEPEPYYMMDDASLLALATKLNLLGD